MICLFSVDMVKFKIIHRKKDCIGCGACAAICPDFWEMDNEGMAHLKGSTVVDENLEREIATEEEKASAQEAIDVCPVNVISLEKLEE